MRSKGQKDYNCFVEGGGGGISCICNINLSIFIYSGDLIKHCLLEAIRLTGTGTRTRFEQLAALAIVANNAKQAFRQFEDERAT